MSKYVCNYMNHVIGRVDWVYVARLDDVTDGFWINADMEFTKASDCMYWIPSSCIRYVHRDLES